MKKKLFMLIAVMAVSISAYADEWCRVRGGTNDNAVTLSHTKSDQNDNVTVSLSHEESKDVVVYVKVTNPNNHSKNVRVVIGKGYTSATIDKNIDCSVPNGTYTYDLVGSSCN